MATCSINCASYNVCDGNNANRCIANKPPCTGNGLTAPNIERGSVITVDLLEAMRNAMDREYNEVGFRREGVKWQPLYNDDYVDMPEMSVDTLIDGANYWKFMSDNLALNYAEGPVSKNKGSTTGFTNAPAPVTYKPNTANIYPVGDIITAEKVSEMYKAIDLMITDCICHTNVCTCNKVCNCNVECGCNGHY